MTEFDRDASIERDRHQNFWSLVNLGADVIKTLDDFEAWCAAADTIFGKGYRYRDDGLHGAGGECDVTFRDALVSVYRHDQASFDDSPREFAIHSRAMLKLLDRWSDELEERFEEETGLVVA